MKIGIPKEIKNHENRVAITPAGVLELVHNGHQIFIEQSAGLGSGYSDQDYQVVGATLITKASDVFKQAELILKVKEPQKEECAYIKEHHIIFTYLHLASSYSLTQSLISSKSVCIAYETVQLSNKTLPLLVPMSEVAGRIAIQEGARFLLKPFGGRGILLGGVTGVKAANVLIIGAGVVGLEAAKMAIGLGAKVTMLDVNLEKLKAVKHLFSSIQTLYSTEFNISNELLITDLLIGAVLIPGGKAPKLVTKAMIKTMKKGSVVIDVAVDQGGCIETCHPTTHEYPTYVVDDVIHYGVVNMPGAVPFTSTQALTNTTLPYVLQIANKGWKKAIRENEPLQKGVNLINGHVVYEVLAKDFDLPYVDIQKFM